MWHVAPWNLKIAFEQSNPSVTCFCVVQAINEHLKLFPTKDMFLWMVVGPVFGPFPIVTNKKHMKKRKQSTIVYTNNNHDTPNQTKQNVKKLILLSQTSYNVNKCWSNVYIFLIGTFITVFIVMIMMSVFIIFQTVIVFIIIIVYWGIIGSCLTHWL